MTDKFNPRKFIRERKAVEQGSKKKYKPRLSKRLTPREAKVIEEYCKHGNGKEALRAAGYSQHSDVIRRNRNVREALKGVITKAQKKSGYNLEQAMQEAEDAIAFAKKTDNANAYVKAVELRSKLNGLLVEKYDVRQSGFSVVITGLSSAEVPVISPVVVKQITKGEGE